MQREFRLWSAAQTQLLFGRRMGAPPQSQSS